MYGILFSLCLGVLLFFAFLFCFSLFLHVCSVDWADWLTRSLSAARTLLKLETLMNVSEGEWQLFNFYFYYSSFSLRDEVAECDRRRGELFAHFFAAF